MNTKENKKHKHPWVINAGVLTYKSNDFKSKKESQLYT